MSVLADYARTYAARGWSIIPVAGKKPTLPSWKQYQSKQPSPETVQGWFQNGKADGLAVICGKVSGDLIVRDFDTVEAYQRWADEFPTLAEILPTVRTARGYHVYFTGETDRIIEINSGDVHEGELRGAGYVVLPPSRHPTGSKYRWIVPLPDGPIPGVDAVEAGLLPDWADKCLDAPQHTPMQQRERRGQREQSLRRKTENTEAMLVVRAKASGLTLEELLASTLPRTKGQRNWALFDLARTLRAEPAYADADIKDLRPIVRRWHNLALPVIGTKPFDDTWADFVYAWPRVKFPKGAGPMEAIFECAKARNPPKAAARYERPGVQLLVTLCCELQRYAGDGPFYLACRTAGRLLDVDHRTAWKWLGMITADGVLCVSETGGRADTRFRATRYRYVDDDD